MDESYVRPVTGAKEPGPAWLPVLRFRLVVVALIALLAFGSIEIWARYFDPNRAQDPGVEGDTNVVDESPAG